MGHRLCSAIRAESIGRDSPIKERAETFIILSKSFHFSKFIVIFACLPAAGRRAPKYSCGGFVFI